jgi:integrase
MSGWMARPIESTGSVRVIVSRLIRSTRQKSPTGADVSRVSKTMGHRNISMTNDTYGHLFDEGAKDTSDKARGFVPRRRQA